MHLYGKMMRETFDWPAAEKRHCEVNFQRLTTSQALVVFSTFLPCKCVHYFRADELDADIRTVRAGDEAAAIRRLEAAMKSLRIAFKEVKELAQGAEQAAAKCEVSPWRPEQQRRGYPRSPSDARRE